MIRREEPLTLVSERAFISRSTVDEDKAVDRWGSGGKEGEAGKLAKSWDSIKVEQAVGGAGAGRRLRLRGDSWGDVS